MKRPRIESYSHDTPRRRPPIEKIIRVVSDVMGVSSADIVAKDRTREFVDARQVVCHVAVKQFGYSRTYVARKMGRDHSTVIYSIKAAAAKCDTDDGLYKAYCDVLSSLMDYIPRDAAVKLAGEPMVPMSLVPVFVAAAAYQLTLSMFT